MPNLKNAIGEMAVIEQLADKDTIIHRLHPAVKIFSSLFYIIAVISFGRYELSGMIPFLFISAVMMSLAELPYRPLLGRVALVLPFCIFAGVSNILFDTETAFIFGNIPVSFGLISFFSIILKAVLAVSAILILSATTPISELSSQLIRFRIPPIIVLQLTMTYRYISVLLDETSTMYTAYILRTPGQKGIRMKDMGIFVGQLVLRSIDRAQRIYLAMKCRGYNGVSIYAKKKKITSNDLLYLILSILFVLLFRFVNISTLIGNLLV